MILRVVSLLIGTCLTLSCTTLPKLVGNGQMRSEERLIGSFDEIKVGEDLRIELVAGEGAKIKVQGDDNVLYAVKTDLDGSDLVIRAQCDCTLAPTLPIIIEIPANRIEHIQLNDNAKLTARSLRNRELEINAQDRAEINIMDHAGDELSVELKDSAKLTVSGQVGRFEAELKDNAQVDAQQLVVQNAKIDFIDQAAGYLHVVEALKAELEDRSQLTLVKEPKTAQTKVEDQAQIIRKY